MLFRKERKYLNLIAKISKQQIPKIFEYHIPRKKKLFTSRNYIYLQDKSKRINIMPKKCL